MKQPSLAHVLQPKWRTALQRLREERASGGSGKLIILALVGGLFWAGVFGVLYKILKTLRAVEELGPLIPGKMLGLILLSFISILVLSNVITALSSFFLAKDLDLLVSAPVDWLRLYLGRSEGFCNLLDFLILLRGPTSPVVPSEWASQAIMGYLRHQIAALPMLLLWTTAAAFITLATALHRSLYAQGFTKAQVGA